MATSAWLRGPSAMRLTEGLVSVLKEQRPDYIPVLLSGYREHGVFHTQVRRDLKTSISSEAKLPVSRLRCGLHHSAPADVRNFGPGTIHVQSSLNTISPPTTCSVISFLGRKRRGRSRWFQQCQTWLQQDQVTKTNNVLSFVL